jgi:hypothetical protein
MFDIVLIFMEWFNDLFGVRIKHEPIQMQAFCMDDMY